LKREHANRRRWATRSDARRDLMRWIEGWYNQRRLHSTIDYNSPVEYEAMFNRNRNGDGIAA
jgi:putative transposase